MRHCVRRRMDVRGSWCDSPRQYSAVRFRSGKRLDAEPAWLERRGRDLNPRRACTLNGFRDRLETWDLQEFLLPCASGFASGMQDSIQAATEDALRERPSSPTTQRR